MKKSTRVWAAVLAAAVAAALIAGCGPKEKVPDTALIVIAVTGAGAAQSVRFAEYAEAAAAETEPDGQKRWEEIDARTFEMSGKTTLGQVIDELVARMGLYVKTDDFGGARWVAEIGSLIPDTAAREFVAVYSTLEKYSFPELFTVIEGVTYYSANFGIDSMPVLDGAGYCFFVDVY